VTISSVEAARRFPAGLAVGFVIAQVSAPSGLAKSQDGRRDEDVAADEVPATEVKKTLILLYPPRQRGAAGSRTGFAMGGPFFGWGRYFVWLYGSVILAKQTFLSIHKGSA